MQDNLAAWSDPTQGQIRLSPAKSQFDNQLSWPPKED